jgi:hypothetical protein
MKANLPAKFEKYRYDHPNYKIAPAGSIEGSFFIKYKNKTLAVISGCGDGWDHVSISLQHRIPTWPEMAYIKDIFFEPDELVIQFHPPKEKYVNLCKRSLHLWRPWDQKIELPPEWMLTYRPGG